MRLRTEVTPALVDELDPDVVIVATGSQQVRPELPGITDDRSLLLARLRELGVALRTETTLMEIRAGEVTLQDVEGLHDEPAETVVLCLGARPVADLATAIGGNGRRVEVVGDAQDPRKVTEAIHVGGHTALALGAVGADVAAASAPPQRLGLAASAQASSAASVTASAPIAVTAAIIVSPRCLLLTVTAWSVSRRASSASNRLAEREGGSIAMIALAPSSPSAATRCSYAALRC